MKRKLCTAAAVCLFFALFWLVQSCQKESIHDLPETSGSLSSKGKPSLKTLKLLTNNLIDTLGNNRFIGYRIIEGSERKNIANDSTEYMITMLSPYLIGDTGSRTVNYVNVIPFLLSSDSAVYFGKFYANSEDSVINNRTAFLNNGMLSLKNLSSKKSHFYDYSNGKASKSQAVEALKSANRTMGTNSLVCNTIATCNWSTVCMGIPYIYSNQPGLCTYPDVVTPCDYSAVWQQNTPSYQTVCTDEPDPGAPGGGSTGGGTGGGTGGNGNGTPPSASQVEAQLVNKPFALLPVGCEAIRKWLNLARLKVGANELNKLNQLAGPTSTWPGFTHESVAHLQSIDDAYSMVVNMDYYPISVFTMPVVNGQRLTPQQFLEYIRKNINSFVDISKAEFMPYVWNGVNDTQLWNSSNPLGSIVAIDLAGPDNGSVIVSQYGNNTWTFSTIFEPRYGEHPVSGNREFGFVQGDHQNYIFYTRGIDRLTNIGGEALRVMAENLIGSSAPYDIGDALWGSFQTKVANFVNTHGGDGYATVNEISRPRWSDVRDVLDGKKPLSTLSADCPD